MALYPRIAQFKTPADFRARLSELNLALPVGDKILSASENSPLAAPIKLGNFTVGNRWCIHPMEGWDANPDGSPSELTLRRWHNFGLSGAKLIWGGEAAAVQPNGRANPHQTLAGSAYKAGLSQLYQTLLTAHQDRFGKTDDLLVGLQLTHSGRFSRPHNKVLEPKIAYHHPLLDAKFNIDPANQSVVWTDGELEQLIADYVLGAKSAQESGFAFVDVKACHGYLLHEFLSATRRPGKYGGDFAGRTRLLKSIISAIQSEVPGLAIGVRLSLFDRPPYVTSREVGKPMDYSGHMPYVDGFGLDPNNPLEWNLTEPIQLAKDLQSLGVIALNVSCGSPYYNPHIQRPALFPPSDGYQPPEDPLVGVARQIQAVATLKKAVPSMPLVGTGYSYLQEYLPHVAQGVVEAGMVDLVGLGRMVLSYPELPADTLAGNAWQRKKVCRTFSDCTSAPRQGFVSGCYPLDPFYKQRPENGQFERPSQS